MRSAMLGWEFPPHISGGLGTACLGFTQGLASLGIDVLFVLPRRAGDEASGPWRFASADEAAARADGELARISVDAALAPYDTHATYSATTSRATHRPHTRYGVDLFAEVARYARVVPSVLAGETFDLVHAHDWMTYPAGAAAAKAAQKPFIAHVHSTEHDRSGPRADPRVLGVEQVGLETADAVVAVSRYTADSIAARYGVDPQKVFVVHNAPPDDRIAPAPRGPRAKQRPLGGPVVLFLGRVTWQKGPYAFLEAARRVLVARPDVKFVVAGDGDLWPGLVEEGARLGIARNLHFTGFLSTADVARVLDMADVYVMPSVSEPFGITPFEAAARGVPVILSRQSGAAECLTSALHVDFWDVEDLADKMLAVLRHPALAEQLARGAAEELRGLTWRGQAERLAAVYRAVLAAQR